MKIRDSKIYRFQGQNMPVIGPRDPYVAYPDPGSRSPYTLVPPDFMYFTWDSNPTSSAWIGDDRTAGWGPNSGRSAAENGSNAWLVSASVGTLLHNTHWGRRFGMSTDSSALGFGVNGMTTDHQSDARIPTYLYDMILSGTNFVVAFFARSLADFGPASQIYQANDRKTVLAIGTESTLEGVSLVSVGGYFDLVNGGLKPCASYKSGSSVTTEVIITGSQQMSSLWTHYAFGFTNSGIDPTQYLTSLTINGAAFGEFSQKTPVITNPCKPLSGSYKDVMYIGLDGYSNTREAELEVFDIVISTGSFNAAAATESGSHDGQPGIVSRFIYNDSPIIDKLRNYPLTIRANTGSLSRMFGSSGYIEVNQLRPSEKVGCLIGPADKDVAALFCTGSYTIEAWVSCSNVDANLRTIFAYGSSGTPNRGYFGRSAWVYVDNNRNVNLSIYSGSTPTENTGAFVDATVPLNAWTHVQVSVQRDPSSVFWVTASCAINGISAGSRVYNRGPQNGSSGSMWIGMKNHIIENNPTVGADETAVWSGRIGHLKIWQRARTTAEALSMYNSERHFYDDKI